MLNRVTVIGCVIAAAAALLVIVLVSPAIGPRASFAEFGSPALSIEGLHKQVDYRKLPAHAIPEP
jgi:hypothetical protein